MGTRTWFHFSDGKRASGQAIREHLATAGLDFGDFEERRGQCNGVLCFAEFSDSLCAFLREISRTEAGRIIVLATSPAILAQGLSFRLLHAGASDVLAWEEGGVVVDQIQNRLERWSAIDELSELAASHVRLVGNSRIWRALVWQIIEAARFTRTPVLLTGESGTGKELLARLIHFADGYSSQRREPSPDLVTVDCSTLVPELSGSELFGHERGAFTGAVSARAGAFELSDGGVLFLDEVASCQCLCRLN